jgi:RND family efflux transporter MFP subunit
MTRPTRYLLAALALALAAGSWPGWAQDAAPSALVSTVPVAERTIGETLTAFGVLDPDPDQVLSLSLPRAGLINRVWARLGQRVRRGDRLLEVVTAPDARMQYLQAQSAVDYAQRELDRQRRLLDEQLATRAQVDAAGRNLQDAGAALEALKRRGQGRDSEILRAPMDGIVTRLDVSQGQRIQADSTAMLIAAEQRLVARLGIEPEDLDRVQPGTAVTLSSVFAPGITIATHIRDVHAMIDPATHLVEMLAPIPSAQGAELTLGSHLVGRLELASHKALVVPRSAVLATDGRAYVYIVQTGKARRVPVTQGGEDGDLVAVTGALQAGDAVVVSGNYELRDGMAVRETP